jgi:uncharacterized protein (TIGR00730 family)
MVHAESEVVVTVAKQVRRGPPPGAPARNIGRSSPLGATVVEGGVNFSLFSRNAAGVELLFFGREDDATPSRVVRIEPTTNRTYHYWHAFVPRVTAGQIYGYRVEGPSDPSLGLRFDPAKVLLDPYGRGVVVPENDDREAARRDGDNAATAMKSVVVESGAYDWEGDLPLGRPSSRTIIYEMHVRGFTRHPNSGVKEETKAWHGVRLHRPDWGDCSHSLALCAELRREGFYLHLVLGSARVRAAGPRRRTAVAAMDRHRARSSARYRPLAAGAGCPRPLVSGRGPFGRHAVCRRPTGRLRNHAGRPGSETETVSERDGFSEPSDIVRLGDEQATAQVLSQAVLGLWEVVNNLTRLRPTRRERYRVSIFGSARTDVGHWGYADVRDLAAELARLGCDIVTGGGPGLMQAANEGARMAGMDSDGGSVGIRVDLPFEQDVNPFVTQAFEHRTFFSRLHHFVLVSDAFVVVPGGIGTVLETMMIWQLLQVRKLHDTPLIMAGAMWAELVEWARRSMLRPDGPLASPEDFAIPICCRTGPEVLDVLRDHHRRWKANQEASS